MTKKRLALDVGLPLLASKTFVFVTTALVLALDPNLHSGFLHPFNGWDSASYIKISQDGYPACAHLPCKQGYLTAFLYGFPFLIRFVTNVINSDPILAGLIVNVIAEAVALYYIFCFVARERDHSAARFVVWAVALAPFAVFLTTVYTESTFLAAAAACLYYARGNQLGKAAVAAAIACSVRLTGVCLVPVLLIEVYRQRGPGLRLLVILLLAVLPLAGFAWYMKMRTGDITALFDANHDYFFHSLAPPWQGFSTTLGMFNGSTEPGDRLIWGRELLSGVIGLATVIAAVIWTMRKRLALSITTYCIAAWVVATAISWWLSVGRYELAMFPVLIILADLSKKYRIVRPLFVAAGGALLVWNTSIYATGAWLS